MTGPEEFEHEQQEAEKLRFLRQAWQEGIDSGDAGEVDFSALKQEARARIAASKEWTSPA
jgi:antitoxin ParD1/3/4